MFNQHYIIVDNFYNDAMAVRNTALSMPRDSASGNNNYAGCMTQMPWFGEPHCEVFSHLTNEAVEASDGLCGFFRFTTATDTWKQHIHYDPKIGQIWAGVIYLSAPHDINRHEKQFRTGTTFWQHNRTGLTSIPLEEDEIKKHGWYTVDDLRTFLETDGMNEDLWTETMYIPARFNRLILFRPWMFHSPGQAFGDSAENCRLVQLFFLRIKGTREILAAESQ